MGCLEFFPEKKKKETKTLRLWGIWLTYACQLFIPRGSVQFLHSTEALLEVNEPTREQNEIQRFPLGSPLIGSHFSRRPLSPQTETLFPPTQPWLLPFTQLLHTPISLLSSEFKLSSCFRGQNCPCLSSFTSFLGFHLLFLSSAFTSVGTSWLFKEQFYYFR